MLLACLILGTLSSHLLPKTEAQLGRCSGTLNLPENGHYESFGWQQTTYFLVCNEGYVPTGTSFTTCVNGQWLFAGNCVKAPAECAGSPPPIANGYYRADSLTSALRIQCLDGYQLNSFVSSFISCDPRSGLWTYPMPNSCLSVSSSSTQKAITTLSTMTTTTRTRTLPTTTLGTCDDEAGTVENGEIVGDSTNIGSVRQISCYPGYQLYGSKRVICGSNLEWSITGQCLQTCSSLDIPRVENGAIDPLSAGTETFQIGSTVAFLCDPGFQVIGSGNFECMRDGSWQVHGSCVEDTSTMTFTGPSSQPRGVVANLAASNGNSPSTTNKPVKLAAGVGSNKIVATNTWQLVVTAIIVTIAIIPL